MAHARLILRSMPGEPMQAGVIRAARPILAAVGNDRVCYISAASMHGPYLALNHAQWAGIGSIEHLDVESVSPAEADEAMRAAALISITGGNTFALAHRLRRSGVWTVLRDHLVAGRPLIGISAGAAICGRSILLSNDVNAPGLTEFGGLDLLPLTLNVHDPVDAGGAATRAERIAEWQAFHPEPALALADDAEIRTIDAELHLAEGSARLFAGPGAAPVALSPGRVQLG